MDSPGGFCYARNVDPPAAPASIKLHCLGGSGAPPGIAEDLARLPELPATARQSLWEALGPCLVDPLDQQVEELLSRFCRVHRADDDRVAAVIKACRFLLREACSLDLSRALFAEDLARLSGPDAELAAILLPGYDAAKAQIRAEILRGSLADHGKLLEGIDWRVDYLTTSSRGDKLRIPVALLTLRYREGKRKKRVTLQLLPDAIKDLRAICDRMLS